MNTIVRARRKLWRLRNEAPKDLGTPATSKRRLARRVRYFGLTRRCNLCGARLNKFVNALPPFDRRDALCPVCGSVEWYRYGWWFLSTKHADRLQGRPRVLHVAAEPEVKRRFQSLDTTTYVAFDMDIKRATLLGDLQQLPFVDGAFDLLYCSHVLEHVTDDELAMRELRRVVAPDGAALIQVPITAESTWGDPSITDPDERLRLFGQDDHVRRYGPDFVDLMTKNGWKVERVSVEELPEKFVKRHGFPQHEVARAAFDIFWCRPG